MSRRCRRGAGVCPLCRFLPLRAGDSFIADSTSFGKASSLADLYRGMLAEFARVGAWNHARGLHEAALLLSPDDVDLRLAVIADHRQWSVVCAQTCGCDGSGAPKSSDADDGQSFDASLWDK